MEMQRCAWVNLRNPIYLRYHDEEWGVPVHDDARLFELLILESFQAGLSWECVLNKREAFRAAFDGFDPVCIAAYGDAEIERLMQNTAIIRNRRKIEAAIGNSRIFLQLQAEFGSFDRYLWGFTDGQTLVESWRLRTVSPLSDRISLDLRRRGMRSLTCSISALLLLSIWR